MHRTHDAPRIANAVEAAREAGIDNISLDLIFALPAALRRDWRRDLGELVALAPEHVSLYGLTIEPRTPLARWRDRGQLRQASDERYAREFLVAHEILASSGFQHYEVSNFARPGRESRHNLGYWERVPYEGVGPSAHAFDGKVRKWNVAGYSEWARRCRAGTDPVAESEQLGVAQELAEVVYLGLRTTAGIVIDGAELDRIRPWIQAGWASLNDRRLRLTPEGWLRLDTLAGDLTAIGSR